MGSAIAAISDCHLGYRHRFSVERLRDYDAAFREAVEKAKSYEPGLWLFGGDLLHHSKPNPVSMRLVVQTLRELAQSAPVVVAIGNHEIEGHLGTTYATLYGDIHERIHVLSTEQPIKVVDVAGKRVNVLGFQFIRNRTVAEESLRDLSKGVERRQGAVNILFLHQAIERYLEPHEIGLPALREVAPRYDLVVSGHVHKHQEIREISDVTPAYYIGATERVSFNEAANPTGFMVFRDFDFRRPEYVPVSSAPMRAIKDDLGKKSPDEINAFIARSIEENKSAKLLQVNLTASVDGEFLDVRRDWKSAYPDFTVLDVNVTPAFAEKHVELEKPELNEDLIREYFEKTGRQGEEELLAATLDLYERYGS